MVPGCGKLEKYTTSNSLKSTSIEDSIFYLEISALLLTLHSVLTIKGLSLIIKTFLKFFSDFCVTLGGSILRIYLFWILI